MISLGPLCSGQDFSLGRTGVITIAVLGAETLGDANHQAANQEILSKTNRTVSIVFLQPFSAVVIIFVLYFLMEMHHQSVECIGCLTQLSDV